MARKRKKLVKIMLEALLKIDPGTLSVRKKIRLVIALMALSSVSLLAFFSYGYTFQADTIAKNAPNITFTSPQDSSYTQNEQVIIRARAVDNSQIQKMTLYIDKTKITSSNNDELIYNWDISDPLIKNGAHQITINAIDNENNMNSKSITIYKY